MADLKISQLTASTTPLAGTEVLPIVQSGATKQVSVANLTAGRAISATQLTLSTGNLIVANGQGVDFSATPGTGTSELFNDYEEGTWTPTYTGSGSNPTVTYLVNVGTYTKIGRVVYWSVEITTTASTGGSGTLQIAGFPFACGSRYAGGAVINYANGWTTAAPNVATIFNGATVMPLYANGTTTFNDVAVGNLTNGVVYLVAFGSYSV